VASAQSSELERELKFEAPLNVALPDLRDLVGRTERLPQRLFSSTYFDTAGKRLWARGLTLRFRAEGLEPKGTWTLKLPLDSTGPALERTEMSWSGTRDSVPAGVVAVTRGVIRREPLREIVELETTRQRLTLRDDGDRALGEIDDDVVRIVDGPRRGDRFRQVEFELATDEDAVVGAVVDRFASAHLSIGAAPKVAVALGLVPQAQDGALRLDKKSSLADVVRVALLRGLEQLLDHDWRLRVSAPALTREDVHKARVAARRLRSNLKTLASALDPVWTGHVRDDLTWIGSVLGEIRDLDVLAGHVVTAPGELQGRLSSERETAVEGLMAALASERYLNLLDRLHVSTDHPPVVTADDGDASGAARDRLTDFVAADWHALRRRVRASGPEPSDRQLHKIRISAKRLRYAAEMAEPVVGKRVRGIAKAAEDVQTVLGEHHDAVEAESWLRAQVLAPSLESTDDVSVASAFAAGCLAAGEQQSQRNLRQSWLGPWRDLRAQVKALAH
jgi:CHAD domain-containing protein